MPYRRAAVLILLFWPAAPSFAQTYSAAADFLFYGDNTEFTTRFRRGDTVLGASGRVFLEVALNDTVTLRGGFFGSGRFAAHEALEHAEPMLALDIARGSSRFVFGSLETVQWRHDVSGPDRETLHGLLPPLQRETLTFERGQEMGLQWLVAAPRLSHDAWVNWQRLNTPNHRERFDAGYRARLGLSSTFHLHGQWHVVHEGGQQFANGSVSDSQASVIGLEWTPRLASSHLSLEGHAVATRNVPDRARPSLTEAGVGVFTRAALERGPWRTHLIVWRSRDTLKAEGDPNYLTLRTDGTMFRKVRDYAELGLTRQFRPAPGVHVFAAARLHRVESHYGYSYRIVGRVRLRHRF